jgi:nucleotide-binding universal stress UspA family protein
MLQAAPQLRNAARSAATAEPADAGKIIVGYDGSEAAERALRRAAALAGDRRRILVLAVAEPYPRTGVTIPVNRDWDEVRRRRHDLEAAREFLSERGFDPETVEAFGSPAEVIVEAAQEAELVVVGSRKLNRLQRLLLGSVSSRVVRDAPCDVLVVR